MIFKGTKVPDHDDDLLGCQCTVTLLPWRPGRALQAIASMASTSLSQTVTVTAQAFRFQRSLSLWHNRTGRFIFAKLIVPLQRQLKVPLQRLMAAAVSLLLGLNELGSC
jgi:hypothetical protein